MAQQAYGLPHALGRMLEKVSGPATIARRIEIGQYVVDAHIEYATLGAAEWYGAQHPAALVGRWISTLHHPDDMRLARLLVTARHFHGPDAAPTRYVSRIRQLHTGAWIPVLKDTEQFQWEGETYWLTYLSQAKDPPLVEQPDRWRDLQRFESQAGDFMGQMTVAEMEHSLHLPPQEKFSPLVHQLENIVTHSEKKSRIPGETTPSTASFTLVAGGTVRLPTSQHRAVPFPYMHWCVRCNEIFTSKEPEPERCGKCKNLYWRGDFLHDVRRPPAKPSEGAASA
jgi:hypothetical protein